MRLKIIVASIVCILLACINVHGEELREFTGDLDETFEIIDINDYDGKLVNEKKLTKKELNIQRIQGKPDIEDLCTGAIGFDNNNLRAYWDQFTDNHIYNQLSDEEKNLWNNLDDIYFEYLTTNKDYVYNSALVTLNDYSYEDLWNMAYMYRYAHPQYFFLRPRPSAIRRTINGEVKYALTIGFYDIFKNGDFRLQESIKVRNKLEEWGAQLQKCKSDYDKALLAHDLICNKVSYDYDVIAPEYDWSTDSHFSQTMYSVLCRDKTVCAGYAITFSCLSNYTGLKNTAVTGSGHAWDMVAINDIWYNMDVCWDDGNTPYYKYFLVSDQFLYNNDNSHYKNDYWKPYISIAYRNYNGFEEYEDDTWYYGTEWYKFGSRKIYYNFGKVRMDDLNGYDYIPTNFIYSYLPNSSKAGKIPLVSRKGYNFDGYYLYNTNTKIDKLNKKTIKEDKDISLETRWSPKKYNITFDKGVYTDKAKKKVKGTTKGIKKVKYDEGVTLTPCGYTYKGHKFKGWTTKKKGTEVEYLDAQRVSNLSDNGKSVKLYAVWEKE